MLCVKSEEAACNLTSTERSHCKGANPVTPRVQWKVTKASSHVHKCIATHSLHPTCMSSVPSSTVKPKGNAIASMHNIDNIIQNLV